MPRSKGSTTRTVQSTKEIQEGKNPKAFIVRQKEGTCLFSIGFKDGGEVPKGLQGMYTNENVALDAIARYQESR